MSRRGRSGRRGGFSLLELVLALLVFQVGLLGAAGMVLVAQQTLTRARLTMRGTVDARRVGDSLLALGGGLEGEMTLPWGVLSWIPGGEGELRVVATAPDRSDTLAALRIWPPPGVVGVAPDSLPGIGGLDP